MSDTYRFKSVDPTYCYPGTTVLRNKLGITDGVTLLEAETSIVSLRMGALKICPIRGNFDADHLRAIHWELFSPIYGWAGSYRTVDIAIVYPFCHHEFIESSLQSLFSKLHEEDCLSSICDKDEFAERLAYYLGELNIIHPFREGNGRTQRLFFEYLANKAGWSLSFGNVSKEQMADASQAAFFEEYDLLKSIILKSLKKIG